MRELLDARQLRAFRAVVQAGNFRQAGRDLHLAQSSVSYLIKALETEVGCRLLDRVGRKVSVTQAGEQLLHHSERILEEMELARRELGRLGKWGQGRLRIAASPTVCLHVLPGVLREFKESFPDHTVTVEPVDTHAVVAALLDRRADLGLGMEPPGESQLECRPLFRDDLRFVVDSLHPWARGGRVVREEVPRQQYVIYSKGSLTFRLIESYFLAEDTVLNAVMELGSMEVIKELVKLGLGVSILAPWILKSELEEGSLVALPLGPRRLERRWGILHWKGRRLSLAEETFVGLCRSVVRDLHQVEELPEAGSGRGRRSRRRRAG